RKAVTRVPWLYLTELLRNIAIVGAGIFLLFPGIWVGFRLSLATEVVVLRDTTAFGAFQRSFHLTAARLERWLEMIAMSAFAALALPFLCVIGFLATRASWVTWVRIAFLALPLVMTVIQYAWTFFYLRLEEIDVPLVVGSVPSAGRPGQADPTA